MTYFALSNQISVMRVRWAVCLAIGFALLLFRGGFSIHNLKLYCCMAALQRTMSEKLASACIKKLLAPSSLLVIQEYIKIFYIASAYSMAIYY